MILSNIESFQKVYISHSKADREYAKAMAIILEDCGIPKEDIICSSHPSYKASFSSTEKDYLENLSIYRDELFVVFLLSDNYYDSKTSLIEMGALWVLKKIYVSIEISEITNKGNDCIIDLRKSAIRAYLEVSEFRDDLKKTIQEIVSFFNINTYSDDFYARRLDSFFKNIGLSTDKSDLSILAITERVKAKLYRANKELTIQSIVKLGYSREIANDIINNLIQSGDVVKTSYGRIKWK